MTTSTKPSLALSLLAMLLSCAPDTAPTTTTPQSVEDARLAAAWAAYEPGPLEPNGAIRAMVEHDGAWHALGTAPADEFLRDVTFVVDVASAGDVVVRLDRQGGHAAHVDAVLLDGAAPEDAYAGEVAVEALALAARDFDVVDFIEPITLRFARPAGRARLQVTARVEAETICDTPFFFPTSESAAPPLPAVFMPYRVGSSPGALELDGDLAEVEDDEPLVRARADARTGHPTSDVVVWARDDGERLYVAIDFSGDNTQDGGKDFAALYVKTTHGVQEFKVSVPMQRHGVVGFGRSRTAPWRHKRYELAIPLAGLDGPELALAFAAYGTCSPCTCPPGEEFDPANNCCRPEDKDNAGYCCTHGVGGDGECLPPPIPVGATFDIKILERSGIPDFVNDVSDGELAMNALAVGQTQIASTVPSAAGWRVGLRSSGYRTLMLDVYDDHLDEVPTRAFGVNTRGETVGARAEQAFVLRPVSGLPYDADTLPAHYFFAGGQTYSPNLLEMTILPGGTTGAGTDLGAAYAINNDVPATIAGAIFDDGGAQPAMWHGESLSVLQNLEVDGAGAVLAINDAGVAAGFSTRLARWTERCVIDGVWTTCDMEESIEHPVVWNPQITDLGVQCPQCNARAVDINEDGTVVGWTEVPGSDDLYPFVYVSGTAPAGMTGGMNVMGFAPTSSVRSYGHPNGGHQRIGVNDYGDVVGSMHGPNGERAFILLTQPGFGVPMGMYWLEDLIPTIQTAGEYQGLSTHFLRGAVDITNSGHIVAYAHRRDRDELYDNEYYLDLFPTGAIAPDTLQAVDDPFRPPADPRHTTEDNDPVNTSTGELIVRAPPDLSAGALAFERHYASGIDERAVTATLPLGPGWRHRWQWSLVTADGGDDLEVTLVSPEGTRVVFRGQAGGLVAPPGYAIAAAGGGYDVLVAATRQLYTFDDAGRLTRVAAVDGYAQTLGYTGSLLTSVADDFGHVLTLGYDGDHVASVSDGTRTAQLAYDPVSGALTEATDPLGHATTYQYDTAGLLAQVALPEGNAPWTTSYQDRRVTLQTDALGAQEAIAYDDGGAGRTTLTDPQGHTRVHAHLPLGQLASITDAAGFTTTYIYGPDGARTGSVDGLGRESSVVVDPATGNVLAQVTATGETYLHEYAARAIGTITVHDRVKTTYPDGTADTVSYVPSAGGVTATVTDRGGYSSVVVLAPNGQPTESTNALGGVTAYVYDGEGRLASVTSPVNDVTTVAHVANGADLVTTTTRPAGAQLAVTYDAARRVTAQDLSSADVGDAVLTSTYAYDDNGNLISSTDALGHVTEFTYDAKDRLTAVIDAAGTFAVAYDERGDVALVTDRTGVTAAFTYDARGDIATMADKHGHTWSFTYDAVRRVTSRTSPNGATVSYAYDDDARTFTVTDPLGGTTTYATDAMGRTVSFVDPVGRTTCFSYDARGDLASATLPSAALTSPCAARTGLAPDLAITAQYTWNAAGLLASVTDPNEQVWTRAYDVAGRLVSTADPLGRETRSTYADARLASVVHENGDREDISYDGYGRVAERAFSTSGGLEDVIAYEHDAVGRLTRAGDDDFAYGGDGALASANGVAFTSDAEGRLLSMELAPGRTVTYAYAYDRLVSVVDWQGDAVTFAYDELGRVATLTRHNGVVTTYAYDANNRVVSIREAHGASALASIALTFGQDGRIAEIARAGHEEPAVGSSATSTRTVDDASQLDGYGHDDRGRMTSAGARSYAWTAAGRLGGYVEGGVAVSFVHDSLGQVVRRTEGTEVTDWRYSHAHALPCPIERNRDGAITYFVCAPNGALLYAIDATTGERRYLHFDEVGNTRLVTDDAGAVVARYAYLPFGEVAGGTDDDVPFTYGGRWGVLREGATGLFHMRMRVYDATLQRFLSRDPVAEQLHPLATNPYAYAANNPLAFIDPIGASPTPAPYGDSDTDKIVTTVLDVNTGATWVVDKGAKALSDRTFKEAVNVRQTLPSSPAKLAKLDGLWKKIDALDKTSSRAAMLGQTGDVIGSALEGYKTAEKLNAIHSETLSCHERVLRTYDSQLRQVRAGLKAGSLRPELAEELSRAFAADFDAALEMCRTTGTLDTAIASLEGFKNTLQGITPAPVQWGFKAAGAAAEKLGLTRLFVVR